MPELKQANLKLFANDCMLNVTTIENKTAPAVIVFLHGGPGSGAESLIKIPAIAKLLETFSAVFFDQRGSGNSDYDLSKGLSIEQITDDVKCVINHAHSVFKDIPVYLCGMSFGGLLALLFLNRFPNAVDKAIISSPSIFFGKDDIYIKQIEFLRENADTMFSAKLARKIHELDKSKDGLITLLNLPEFGDYLNSYQTPVKGFEGMWHFHAMRDWILSDYDLCPFLTNVGVETLFLQGQNDKSCPPQTLINAIHNSPNPHVCLSVFKNCGHAIFDDCQKDFVRIITEFCLG